MPVLTYPSLGAVTQFTRLITFPPVEHRAFRVDEAIFHVAGGAGSVALRRNTEASAPANTAALMRLEDLIALAVFASGGNNTIAVPVHGELILSGFTAFVGSVTSGDVALQLVGQFVSVSTVQRALIARRSGQEGTNENVEV